jgi:hypothetical protein
MDVPIIVRWGFLVALITYLGFTPFNIVSYPEIASMVPVEFYAPPARQLIGCCPNPVPR